MSTFTGLSETKIINKTLISPLLLCIRCFLLSLSVICLGIITYMSIATIVNPRRQLASTFHSFPAVTLNSRSIKLDLFRKYNAAAPVAGLVMGSSSSLTLSPNFLQQLTGKRFFNAAVFMGTPRDFLAQYRLMKHEAPQINVLVIGIDSFALREAEEWNELTANWEMQTALHPSRTGAFFKAAHWITVYKGTFAPGYAQDVRRSIEAHFRPRPPAMVFRADGTIDYMGWDRDVARHADRDMSFSRCADEKISWLSNSISAQQQNAIEELIREARTDGVDVRLFMTPYNPTFFLRLATAPEAANNLNSIVAYLKHLQTRFGITVFDFIHEASFGGDPHAWYDCNHFFASNARLLAQKVTRRELQVSATQGAGAGTFAASN